jgi:uncharacterized protein YydD (DUF2326 family)
MNEEIEYLKAKIAKIESSLIDVNRMAAQSGSLYYIGLQRQHAEHLRLLKNILTFIEKP